jgi:hypothetical protein
MDVNRVSEGSVHHTTAYKETIYVEALLIYAYQPAYNTKSKHNPSNQAKGLRIFNTGNVGYLLPEVSYRYFADDTGLAQLLRKGTRPPQTAS